MLTYFRPLWNINMKQVKTIVGILGFPQVNFSEDEIWEYYYSDFSIFVMAIIWSSHSLPIWKNCYLWKLEKVFVFGKQITTMSEAATRICFAKKSVLQNFAKFTGNHMSHSLFLRKLQPESLIKRENLAQVFSCEFSEFFQNTIFEEHLWWLFMSSRNKISNIIFMIAIIKNLLSLRLL